MLFADNAVIFAESENLLQRLVNEFDKIHDRMKLIIDVRNSKASVFTQRRIAEYKLKQGSMELYVYKDGILLNRNIRKCRSVS